MRRLGLAVGCLVGALILLGLALRPNPIAGPCRLVTGPVMLAEVPEASGLAVSRRNAGVIWAHNDSGNDSVLFALDPTGAVIGRLRVPVRMRDWEGIAAAHCASGDCLYLGDIGDNSFARKRILIFRVPEPAPTDPETSAVDTLSAVYPDGPHNAEAMLVIGSDLFIVTRDRSGRVYRSAIPDDDAGVMPLQSAGQLNLAVVTDAEASPDEKSVVVRTSHEVVFYRTADFVRGEYVPYLNIPIDGLKESQGEGVAIDANGMLFLASEGRPWNRAGRLLALHCNI